MVLVHESVTTQQLIVSDVILAAGKTGRPAFFQAVTNATLGGWFNASKSYMDCDATGGITGLMSAHCMELRLPSTVQPAGHLTVGEFELVTQASTTVNTNVSMAWFQVSGDNTARQHYLDTGTLFELTGFDDAGGNIFETAGNPNTVGTLRIKIDDAVYYICLASAVS